MVRSVLWLSLCTLHRWFFDLFLSLIRYLLFITIAIIQIIGWSGIVLLEIWLDFLLLMADWLDFRLWLYGKLHFWNIHIYLNISSLDFLLTIDLRSFLIGLLFVSMIHLTQCFSNWVLILQAILTSATNFRWYFIHLQALHVLFLRWILEQ